MYIYVAILLAGLAGGATGAWQVQNWRHGAAQNEQAKVNDAIRETREAAQQGAAEAIAALKPVNTTIVQKVQREITENVRYVDCKLTPGGVLLANQAITGKPAEPAGGDKLPAAQPAK